MAKLTALWWWIDRWRKSTAYTDLTLEEQGAYRNLLDEAHLRGGPLPNDERILAKACGDALRWQSVKANVMKRFTLTPDGWRNDTLDSVLKESHRRADKQRQWRERSGNTSGNVDGNADGNTGGSPSPSPSPSLITGSISDSGKEQKIAASNGNGHESTARSKRPIYQSDRFVVFEWQLDDLGRMLGPHTIGFDLHHFFDDLSQSSRTNGMIIPANSRNGQFWEWLQAEVKTEAQRRGLQFAEVPFEGKLTKQLRHATEESIKRHGARPRRISSNL